MSESTTLDDNWRTTTQEWLLDHIYESSHGGPDFKFDIYGVTEKRSEAVIYVEDPDGDCWMVTAVRHPHG